MWMMGATLNSSSSAAREMDMVLKSEIAAHAAYDPNSRSTFHGVPVPGKKKVVTKKINRDIDWKSNYLVFSPSSSQRSNSSTTSQSNEAKSAQPQTLEELLERQWEQGSQFLMEQASHFDSEFFFIIFGMFQTNFCITFQLPRCFRHYINSKKKMSI